MLTFAVVKRMYREELLRRAPEAMEEVGDGWADQFQGFFFPNAEDVVDQCALVVFRDCLALNGQKPTEAARKQVRKVINTDTITEQAISIVFLACFTPVGK
jgi:hypothetical protein